MLETKASTSDTWNVNNITIIYWLHFQLKFTKSTRITNKSIQIIPTKLKQDLLATNSARHRRTATI